MVLLPMIMLAAATIMSTAKRNIVKNEEVIEYPDSVPRFSGITGIINFLVRKTVAIEAVPK